MDLREVTEFFRDFAGYIITIGVIIFIFTFVVAIQPIAGNSMAPTLEDAEISLVSRFSYLFGKPNRNDVVVLRKDKKSYVKRIVGLPGENIKYLNGLLYIDEKPFRETFLSEDVVTSNFLFEDICNIDDCPDGVIPNGKYLVLGDNRPESMDSRDSTFGLVDKKEIKGKVIFIAWPVSKMKKVR